MSQTVVCFNNFQM